MQPALRGEAVAKSVGRPKKPGGVGKSVRIDTELANKARMIALRKGIPLSEYLTTLLGTPIDRDYRTILEEMALAEKTVKKSSAK